MKDLLLEKRLIIGRILDVCGECNKVPQKSSGKATFGDINYCKSECNLWNEMQECRAIIEKIQK
jgi:hypothetical protein